MDSDKKKIADPFPTDTLSHETVRGFSRSDLVELLMRLNERLAEQDKEIAELRKLVDKLKSELAKVNKNSSTSSKPPSSDIVKPPQTPKTGNNEKRSKGAQKGHPRHERLPFPEEEITDVYEYTLDTCPDCGSFLSSAAQAPRVIQQVEIVEKPIQIDEHRGLAYWCNHCQKIHYAPLPPAVEKAGLFGPRLTARVAYLKGAGHTSFTTIQKYLRDVLGITISTGYLSKLLGKVSHALDDPYQELLKRLACEPWLNVDETGHKENGGRFWTWCFRAQTYALFKIAASRGSQILFDVLGEDFAGILGCDYFSAYRKYMKDGNILVQFCLAHLIRDLKYLMTLPDQTTAVYGENLLNTLREMFGIIHQRQTMDEEAFVAALTAKRQEILSKGMSAVPQTREAQNLAKRLRLHGDAYFRFIATPGIEPTNNLAEQAIRFVVIDRVITQGTRSERGRKWCERVWTVLASCAYQDRSAFEFLHHAIQAYFTDQPAPSLLALPP